MPPIPHAKPENVLKRAQELIAVEQSQAALTLLHEHITSKKSRNTPIASLEPVILLFVELCVELRKGKTAKDGLYQYKNIAQNTTVQTIEMVLRNFIERAEAKVTNAQQIAEQITLDQVDDLENLETPESLLLATVSGEQSKDRTDRKVVTPWLKFLWETYRTVLDILRNNARLENMYQQTATQAFGFCLKYTRKTEFRRLCELLRNHLVNASKYSAQMHAINLNDPDTQQRHLDIRFQQLNAAVDLELWQEAFRSVEDIHNILTVSKRPPKAIMMANYYEKLTRIFRTSDNHLFHAASWNRYFNLLRTSAAALAAGTATKKESPVTNDAEFSRVASFVILSALSIPVISTARSRSTTETEEANKRTRSSRLTNLLGMSNAPTRTGLFKDILAKGLLKRARPEIRELYTILEVEFHPLSICKKIAPILTKIAEDEDMNRYIAPLQQVILTRLFQQLSQVYDTVQLDFVINLVSFPEPFEIDAGTIEKFIMNACKKGDLAIRVDHAAGALTFESDIFSSPKSLQIGSSIATSDKDMGVQRLQSTPQEIVRTSLSRLAKTLYLTCTYVDPSFTDQRIRDKAEAFARAEAGAKKEHEETLARREIIEQRKEAAENAAASKEKEESRLRAIRQQQLAAAESQRLAEENKKRERERQDKDLQRIREQELRKQIEELQLTGIKLDVDISTLDSTAIRKMKLDQLEKEKKDTNEKLRITSKRIDHLERAYRKEELALLPQDYERQRKEDLEAHTETINQLLSASKQKHEEDVALKKRLSRLVPQYESFRDDIRSRRHEEFEARQKKAEQQLQIEMDKRRKAVREERERQRREEEEAERARIEEEERLAREEEERIAKEEEDAKKKEAARAEQEVRRKEREEAAAKQREREAQAEAKMEERRRQRLQEGGRPAPAPAAAPAAAPAESAGSSTFRPTKVPAAAGAGGGWRERLAAKKAAEEAAAAEGGSPADANGEAAQPTPEPVQEPEPEAVEEGGPRRYRPGAFRQKAPTEAVMSTEDAAPRERPPREQREPREPREQREPREPRENRESRQPTETQEGEAAAPRERPEGRAGTWGRTNRTEGEGGAEGGSKYRPPRREGTAGGAGESSEGGAPRYQARRTEGGDGKYVPRQRQTGEDGQPRESRESREPRDPNAPPGERRYEAGRGFGRGRGGGNMGERTGSGRGEGRTGSGRGGERSDSRRGGADKPADRAGGSSWR